MKYRALISDYGKAHLEKRESSSSSRPEQRARRQPQRKLSKPKIFVVLLVLLSMVVSMLFASPLQI